MSRYYKKEGKELPSVTTITGQLDKPALMIWAANCAVDYIIEGYNKDLSPDEVLNLAEVARKNFRKVSQKALNIGSQVHHAIENHILTGREPHDPQDEVLSAFIAYLEWREKYEVEPIKTEHTLYGPNWAGTCDLICTGMFRGKREKFLIDHKTSKAVYPEMRYQIAAYKSATDCVGCGILRVDKITGIPEWKDTTKTYDDDLRVFSILTDLWWATHKIKRQQFIKAGGEIS